MLTFALMFTFTFEILPLALAACALISGVWMAGFVLWHVIKVRKRVAVDNRDAEMGVGAEALPPMSVIVTADDLLNLPDLLAGLMAQDYPAPYEVIVVNCGGSDAVSDTVALLQHKYNNLYMTFMPGGTRNLSRQKLAITLGVKAAVNECLILTRADAKIMSAGWLKMMARHFAHGAGLVLGYTYPVVSDFDEPGRAFIPRGKGSRARSFQDVRDSVQWLSTAISGRPLRGDGRNLGYRRSLFFGEQGFARTLNLVNGDDDVFVEELARKCHCAVELSNDAQVGVMDLTPEDMRRERDARRFTATRLRQSPRLAWSMASWMSWLWLMFSIAALIVGFPSLIPLFAVLAVGLFVWVPLMLSWRKCSMSLHHRRVCATLPWYMLMRPFFTLASAIRTAKSRRNLTWHTIT